MSEEIAEFLTTEAAEEAEKFCFSLLTPLPLW